MAKREKVRLEWTPFKPGDVDDLNRRLAEHGQAPEDAVYLNSIYQVNVRRVDAPGWPCGVIHLSIKTRDKRPLHDWRDLQRIKNEIVGPEHEAVELYPAESRLVDTSNQYQWIRLRSGGTLAA